MNPIYLDHNASTPVDPEVLEAMRPYLAERYGNPSSTHAYGKALRAAIERARGQVAQLIGGAPEEIVFTSGGTESNNLAIRGAAAARPRDVLVHSDAAQSLGKIEVKVDRLGVDLLSIAGHKMYAPVGVGALYVRSGTVIEPLLAGAGHERGLRPGTENTAGIVGLGAACVIAGRVLAAESARQRDLRDLLWRRLAARVPGLALNGHAEQRLPNTLSVRFPAVSGNALLALCDGLAASTGSACHAACETPSAVITAMGIAQRDALGTVRLSLGRASRRDAIEQAVDQLAAAWSRLAGRG